MNLIDQTMGKPPIYLDYNATAPLLPHVRETVQSLDGLPLNASSIHQYGRLAKKHVEDARRVIAEYLGVWPDEVIFTASGTEANNMALSALPGHTLVVPSTEHSSVLNVAKHQAGSVILPVHPDGQVDIAALEKTLQQYGEKCLVSVMLANNETGVIQPIKQISALVHQYGAIMHCDAVQGLGKISFDFNTLGVDMLTIAAHKIGGPIGVGALLVKNNLHIAPLLRGGGQEKGRRAGTENVAAIAGFGSLISNLPDLSHLKQYKHSIAQQLSSLAPDAIIAGTSEHTLSNTVSITMPGVSSETQLMNFDLADICVSAGSACSSGRIEASHVLKAMGYDDELANSAIRISLGWATTEIEVERFISEWKKLYQRLGIRDAA